MKQLRTAALGLSALAGLLVASAGPGTRFGLWSFRLGLALLPLAAVAGLVGGALTLAALARTRPEGRTRMALRAGLVVAAVSVAVPVRALLGARAAPPIHDVTTDTADPPAFAAVLPLRAAAPNSAAYEGDRIAALQRRGYPDIAPLHLAIAPDAAYARALAAARGMRWDVVAADHAAGRIEATATTRWFGFKDDIVVRLRPEGAGTRVDVRSASRVGLSDVGTNAARVRAYLARLTAGERAA